MNVQKPHHPSILSSSKSFSKPPSQHDKQRQLKQTKYSHPTISKPPSQYQKQKQQTKYSHPSIQLKRSRLQYKQQLASNLIQLSNMEYLLKYVNYSKFNSKEIFKNVIKQVENERREDKQKEVGKLKEKGMRKNREKIFEFYENYNSLRNSKQASIDPLLCLELLLIPFQKFTPQYQQNRQHLIQQQIKSQITSSLQKRPQPSHTLTKQQILFLAQQKKRKQKLQFQRELQKSRKSYQYIENLKNKIQYSLFQEQAKQYEMKIQDQLIKDQKQIFQELEILEKQRYCFKMKYYYYEKQEYKENEVGSQKDRINLHKNSKNCNVNPRLFNLYDLLKENIKRSRELYNQYFSRQQKLQKQKVFLDKSNNSAINVIANTIKLAQKSNYNSLQNTMNQKTKYSTNLNFNQVKVNSQQTLTKKINKIQRFLNSILLDQRQIKLIQTQLFFHES